MTSLWMLCAAVWLQAATVPPASVPPASAVPTIDKGALGGVSAARQVTVRDKDAWAALWREHAPARPLPDVDFARETVVGVFLGTRPTAGYAIEIAGYREDGGAVIVQY